MKIAAKFIMAFSLLSLASIEPTFAAGDANRSTQSPSSEKPKKEDNSKPTTAASEVQPSTAARPVESKVAEIKPSTEARPSESKKSSEAVNSREPKPENSNKPTSKPDSKSTKKPSDKSSDSKETKKPKDTGEKEKSNGKDNKTKEKDKDSEGKIGASALASPSPSSSESGFTAKPSSAAKPTVSATPKNTSSDEDFVRIEKSDGNRAVLVVSGPKIGSTIKITITSKGSKK
jgi:hypothetical protein